MERSDAVELQALTNEIRHREGIDPDAAPAKPIWSGDLPEVDPAREAAIEEIRSQTEIRERAQRQNNAMEDCFGERERYRAATTAGFICTEPAQTWAVEIVRNYAVNFMDRLKAGTSLLFYGPPGTGKDHLMACLIRRAIEFDRRVRWRNGMDLFGEVRDRMDGEHSEASFVKQLVQPDVLAISDPLPPLGPLTQFQATMLFRIIDGRYSAGKPTWITVNVANAKEASERMGAQTVDRLTDGAIVIPCNWLSYRKPKP